MALKHAILAALGGGESSGYDLAKRFDVGVANYWAATPQQIYRELDKMESDGLIEARTIEQERRPNKRMFSVTERGIEAMRTFVANEPKPTALRDELLVQVELLDRTDVASVRQHIEQQLAISNEKLARYRESRNALLAERSEAEYVLQARRIGPYLTLKAGIRFEEGNIAWAREALDVLSERGRAAGR